MDSVMIINGKSLIRLRPIKDMLASKERYMDTSHGLAEAGYDIRINQTIVFKPTTWRANPCIEVDGVETKGRFVLASAMEEFQMPKNLVGVVHDKSTWARKGLSVFNTVIEPGWNGFLTLELVFHGNEQVTIHRGQGIAQILFSSLKENGDYGNGKYQNQEDRPVKARA